MAKSTNFNDLILDNIVSVMKNTVYLKGKQQTLLEDSIVWAKTEAENDWKFKSNAFPQYTCKANEIVEAVVELFKQARISDFLKSGCAPLDLTNLPENLNEISFLEGDSLIETYKELFTRFANKIFNNSVVRYKKYGENFSGSKIAYALLNFNYVAKDYLKENFNIEVQDFAGLSQEELEKNIISSLKIKALNSASQAVIDEFFATLKMPYGTEEEIEPIKEENIEELVIEEPKEEVVEEVVEELNVIYSDEEINAELDDYSIRCSQNAVVDEIEEEPQEAIAEEPEEEVTTLSDEELNALLLDVIGEQPVTQTEEAQPVEEPVTISDEELNSLLQVDEQPSEQVNEQPKEEETLKLSDDDVNALIQDAVGEQTVTKPETPVLSDDDVNALLQDALTEQNEEVVEQPETSDYSVAFQTDNVIVNNFEAELNAQEDHSANVEAKALEVINGLAVAPDSNKQQKFNDISRTYIAVKGYNNNVSRKFSKNVLKKLEKNSLPKSGLKKKGLQSDYIEQQQFIDNVRIDCLKIPNNRWQKVENKVKKGK